MSMTKALLLEADAKLASAPPAIANLVDLTRLQLGVWMAKTAYGNAVYYVSQGAWFFRGKKKRGTVEEYLAWVAENI